MSSRPKKHPLSESLTSKMEASPPPRVCRRPCDPAIVAALPAAWAAAESQPPDSED